jgi:pimeloyl-ACP methyl ester carboxylesterase
MSPKTLFCTTSDNISLPLHHSGPLGAVSRRYPVLLLHGLGGNSRHFDISPQKSWITYLSCAGFSVYLGNLRHAGAIQASTFHPRQRFSAWSFMDYAKKDLPSMIEHILQREHAPALHMIGHSMGGMLCYYAASIQCKKIVSICTLGAPLIAHLELGLLDRYLMRLSLGNVSQRMMRIYGRPLPWSRLSRFFVRWLPRSVDWADGILFEKKNCQVEDLYRLVEHGMHDFPLLLLNEIHAAILKKSSNSSVYAWESNFTNVDIPALLLAGSHDRIASPDNIALLSKRWRKSAICNYMVLGQKYGQRENYGHMDLLIGRYLADEIIPLIIDFLVKREGTQSG